MKTFSAQDEVDARKGITVQILFRWTGDVIECVLAGNHDDVKRFLKNV